MRLTESELLALMNVLNTASDYFYFTPDSVPDYMSADDFPLAVYIGPPSKIRHVGGGEKRHYVEMAVEAVDFQ